MRISDWSSDVCSSDLWARQGHDVVRFGAATEGGLADVTVFRRDAAGRLREQIDAARAEPSGEGWMLEDVEVTRPGIPAPIHHDTLEWTAGPDRSLLRSLSAYPRELSFPELLRFAYQPGVGRSPPYLYQFWFHTKLAVPVARPERRR